MKPRITLYSTTYCTYCLAAKRLLNERKIGFEEINLSGDDAQIAAVKSNYGHSTVPIILLDGKLIGGFDELSEWDRNGQLKAALEAVPS